MQAGDHMSKEVRPVCLFVASKARGPGTTHRPPFYSLTHYTLDCSGASASILAHGNGNTGLKILPRCSSRVVVDGKSYPEAKRAGMVSSPRQTGSLVEAVPWNLVGEKAVPRSCRKPAVTVTIAKSPRASHALGHANAGKVFMRHRRPFCTASKGATARLSNAGAARRRRDPGVE